VSSLAVLIALSCTLHHPLSGSYLDALIIGRHVAMSSIAAGQLETAIVQPLNSKLSTLISTGNSLSLFSQLVQLVSSMAQRSSSLFLQLFMSEPETITVDSSRHIMTGSH
jgi:hypothetical protein